MTEADLDMVSENEAICFSMPWSRAAFAQMLHKNEAIYLVAELDGHVVGHCGVTNIVGEGEITNVAVHPDHRRQGIACQMLQTLLEEGEKAGITAFTLEVRAGNQTAVHLYEKAGFVSEGIRPGFYDNPKEDALIMWKR